MKSKKLAVLVAAIAALVPAAAHAHVSVASGPAFANTSQEISFGVGHGCEGADTVSVQIEIPAGVTSVRPETSDFGHADVETDGAGAVVAVTWTKPAPRRLCASCPCDFRAGTSLPSAKRLTT